MVDLLSHRSGILGTVRALARRFTSSPFLPVLAFLATVASTLFVGGLQGLQFWAPEILRGEVEDLSAWGWVRLTAYYGVPFSATIMSIIFCHEMGHYLVARRYRIDTTPPFFIPFPFSLIGTLGAFILIRSPFPHRRALIDVGLAGPFAGFAVTIPALVLGILTSRPSPPLDPESSISFGEPLLFQLLSDRIWPSLPEGHVLSISPIGLAAWFGLLLTAINLLPIGQLDGGHATYAVFRSGAHRISTLAFLALFPMAYFGPSWLVWALLAYALGIRNPHPPTLYDELPLPASRRAMGLLGLATFLLCFTPEPIEFSWMEIYEEILGLFRGG